MSSASKPMLNMDNFRPKNVLLLIYSDPLHFPPTINAANILAERGEKVYLMGHENVDNWRQIINTAVNFESLGQQKKGLYSVIDFVKSILLLRKYLRDHKIEWLIGYDAKSVLPSFLATLHTKTKWVYHQHDFWDYPKEIWGRFLWHMERYLAKKANIISFPQKDRAQLFKQEANLPETPLIVFNGPRRNWDSNIAEPHPIIIHLKKKFNFILVYQGGWSKYFGIEKIFYALAECKTNTCLIVLGEEREIGVKKYYDEIIHSLNLNDKVWFSETYIPYDVLPSFTKFVDAAIAILTKDNEQAPYNNRYLIGASNKIFEYISFGLPVFIQNSTPNSKFYDAYPIGVLIDADQPKLFAEKIDALLSDRQLTKEIATRNINLFNTELNFDYQFNKLINIMFKN